MKRRTLLSRLAQALAALVLGIAGIPAILAALAPAMIRRRGALWKPVGPLDDFAMGEVTEAQVVETNGGWPRALAAKTVFVWRKSAEEFVVYSRNCTDLRCPVVWDRGSNCFFCPCHGGIFAQDGTPMAGPPPRPLYRYAVRVEAGVLKIDLHSLPPSA